MIKLTVALGIPKTPTGRNGPRISIVSLDVPGPLSRGFGFRERAHGDKKAIKILRHLPRRMLTCIFDNRKTACLSLKLPVPSRSARNGLSPLASCGFPQRGSQHLWTFGALFRTSWLSHG
jgi:hypothetical protein